jgi:hypothetical protein
MLAKDDPKSKGFPYIKIDPSILIFPLTSKKNGDENSLFIDIFGVFNPGITY